jgi:sugar phosphate isomerase/epimerase
LIHGGVLFKLSRANKPMKFAICNEIFQGWKLEDTMTYAAKAGYEGIEIAPFTLAKSVTDIPRAERERIRELSVRTGVAICGLHWVLVQAEGVYLNHSDPAVRQRTAAYFCELVDFCADVGGKTIVVGSPKQRNLLPGVTAA